VHILRDPAYLESCTPANPELVLSPEGNLPLFRHDKEVFNTFFSVKKTIKKNKKIAGLERE
jgi:hypothetical protein